MRKSLLIGRYQPFHGGHKGLVDKLLQEKKEVVIAIRNTPITDKNPYTHQEREKMIRKIYGKRIDIISIPDIAEVCYGRDVGYKIRRIRLDKQTEEISATKIRGSTKRILWLTGNVKSGKTALAYLLKERLQSIVLDGDEMRSSISKGLGFSKADRESHNLRVASLAKVLHEQGHNVIVSVIAPFASTRKKIDAVCHPFWIYIKGGEHGKTMPYEPPKKPDLTIDPSVETLVESMEKIVRAVGNIKTGK